MQLCNRIYYFKVYWRNSKFYYKAASCWYFYWIIYDARIHEYQIQYNNLFPKTDGELKTEVKQARYVSIFRKSAQWILFLLSCCTNYHPSDYTHCFRSAIFLQSLSRWEHIVTSQTADPTLACVNTNIFRKNEDWVEVFSYSGSFYIRVNAVVTNPLTHFSALTTIIACIYYRNEKRRAWSVGLGLGNSVVRVGTHTNTNTTAYTVTLTGYCRKEGGMFPKFISSQYFVNCVKHLDKIHTLKIR
jgi:hypothetical protein